MTEIVFDLLAVGYQSPSMLVHVPLPSECELSMSPMLMRYTVLGTGRLL